MLVTKHLLVAVDFNSMEKKNTGKLMATVNIVFTNILQSIFFCVQHLKEIYTGLCKDCHFLGELSL